MSFFIGLLTFVLVLICVALIFLVLIQLPKKDAGVGVAFGGGATDALFGAGSGTVLTKATRYAAISFFILALFVGVLQSKFSAKHRTTEFERAVQQQSSQLPAAPAAGQTAPLTQPAATPAAPVAAPAAVPAETPAK
jgi:preprotein translocase subunit SecG